GHRHRLGVEGFGVDGEAAGPVVAVEHGVGAQLPAAVGPDAAVAFEAGEDGVALGVEVLLHSPLPGAFEGGGVRLGGGDEPGAPFGVAFVDLDGGAVDAFGGGLLGRAGR